MRGSSGRAIKLQKEKERERQKKLRRLKASRGVKGILEWMTSVCGTVYWYISCIHMCAMCRC